METAPLTTPSGFILDPPDQSQPPQSASPSPATQMVAPTRSALVRGTPLPPTSPLKQVEEAIVQPPSPRGRGFLGRMGMAEWLLKYRGYLLEQIQNGKELEVILVDLLLVAALPTAA